jgi:hypothetical protein
MAPEIFLTKQLWIEREDIVVIKIVQEDYSERHGR